MGAIRTRDGTRIYYNDWGAGPSAVFSHGSPLSAEAFEDQPWEGNDLDNYADDLATLVEAFSETDLTEDLAKFDVPTLIIHGDDDQIVPIAASSKLVGSATLKVYASAPHGLCTTPKDRVNAELLAFLT